jgi:hypothetical protein
MRHSRFDVQYLYACYKIVYFIIKIDALYEIYYFQTHQKNMVGILFTLIPANSAHWLFGFMQRHFCINNEVKTIPGTMDDQQVSYFKYMGWKSNLEYIFKMKSNSK